MMDQPSRKTVTGMPWIDSDGDTGFYTGDVNDANIPDGNGMMKYDDGPIVRSRWKEGEMVIEEEASNSKKTKSPLKPALKSDSDVEKQRQLQKFHEKNQQFLQSAQNQQFVQLTQSEYQIQSQSQSQKSDTKYVPTSAPNQVNGHEVEALHQEVYTLQEQVHQLTHELRITQDANQLNKDQSSVEISMLQTELDRQNSRHEQIVASLRNRLVESEMARMKMQDQLSARMEEDAQREEDVKSRWKAMTARVLEDKKWVDEQMNYWKESMEEHRKRLTGAKVQGRLDGGLGESAGEGNSGSHRGKNGSSSIKSHESEKSATDRRIAQRKLWGAQEEGESSSEDEEEIRMFGRN
ncbi:hypothetical protein ACHAWF_003445 [Thalassiosira exigua]